jgi:hypothetical protein
LLVSLIRIALSGSIECLESASSIRRGLRTRI